MTEGRGEDPARAAASAAIQASWSRHILLHAQACSFFLRLGYYVAYIQLYAVDLELGFLRQGCHMLDLSLWRRSKHAVKRITSASLSASRVTNQTLPL